MLIELFEIELFELLTECKQMTDFNWIVRDTLQYLEPSTLLIC